MASSRYSGLDKILGRIEDLDSVNLGILVQRLARERRLQETVFNTIQDGILVIDDAGTVQYANQAGRRMIGLDEKDVGSTRLWKMVPDLARSIDLEELTQSERAKAPVISREIEMNYPEHRIVRLYMVPMEIPQNDGQADGGYVVVLTDVTEAKLSLKERIENERTSSVVRLAAGVAHELGNPLNSLTIHLQLISRQLKQLEGVSDPKVSKLQKSLEICQGEVERLDNIITHFLEAIRPQEPDLNEVNLIAVLDEVMQVQGPILKDRGIRVSIEMEESLPTVLADSNQVKQVYFNIIKNAIEAMGEGGRLRIRARLDDTYAYLQFADSGSGISDEDLSRVFQAYFTTKKSGHGLGMMIVQRIMREHGGHISIESREGVGTVVTLQFPLRQRRPRLLA